MNFDEKLEKIKDILKVNNQIKVSEIEKLFDSNSEEYFKLIDILNDLHAVIIPDTNSDDQLDIDEGFNSNSKDITTIYLKDIGTVKLLSKNEEIELAKKIENGKSAINEIDNLGGDIDVSRYNELMEIIEEAQISKNKLISSNLRLVVHIAKKYVGRGMPFQDLIQAGNMGLMRAADKFDYKLGFNFSTYATWWIRQSIVRDLVENTRTIRIPVHVNDNLIKYNRAKNELFVKLGREPKPSEIAEELNIDELKVLELIELSKEPDRLDKEVGDDGDSSLGDFIADKSNPNPFQYTFSKKRGIEIEKAFSVLTPREMEVMKRRYGFDGYEPMTLEEIGKMFGVSREAIRQQVVRCINKLKKSEYSPVLKELWEAIEDEEN